MATSSPYSVEGNGRPGIVVKYEPVGDWDAWRHWHVHTWADGFGTWHARFVDADGDGARRLAHIARLAIGYELDQRGAALSALPRVARRYSRFDLPGTAHYAER